MNVFHRVKSLNRVSTRHASTDPKTFFQTLNDNLKSLLDKEEAPKTTSNQNTSLPSNFEDEDEEWVDMFNPKTGEWNGPRHGEPTTHGDWQHKGRTTDF